MTGGLLALLEDCTVRLAGHNWQGTGFFVGPCLILTCVHVVRLEQVGASEINVNWRGKILYGKLEQLVPHLSRRQHLSGHSACQNHATFGWQPGNATTECLCSSKVGFSNRKN